MKVCCILLVGFCLFSAPAFGMTVYCTNCSNQMTQALERVTNVSQLNKLIDQYAEAAQQTQQQIRMVQQNIEQYQNMLQNTAQLPAHLVNQLNGSLLRLASLTRELKTQRGDVVGLGQVFMNPESVAALPKISLCHQRGDFQWSFQPFLLSLSRLWGAFSLVLALEQLSGWI